MNDVKITLLELQDHILITYDRKISDFTEKAFKRENIEVKTRHQVTQVTGDHVIIRMKSDPPTDPSELPYGMCIWSTGIGINPFTSQLRKKFPETQTNLRALVTGHYLNLLGSNNIYALGDCATIQQGSMIKKLEELFKEADLNNDNLISLDEFKTLVKKKVREFPQLSEYGKKATKLFREADTNKSGYLEKDEFEKCLQKVDSKMKLLPATAQVASQEGKYLASLFTQKADLKLKQGQGNPISDAELEPFHYRHLGSLAYVGHENSVAQIGDKYAISGYGAWWLWRSVYFSKTVSSKNRIAILTDWLNAKIFGREIS